MYPSGFSVVFTIVNLFLLTPGLSRRKTKVTGVTGPHLSQHGTVWRDEPPLRPASCILSSCHSPQMPKPGNHQLSNLQGHRGRHRRRGKRGVCCGHSADFQGEGLAAWPGGDAHSGSDVGYPCPFLYRTSTAAASGLRGVGVSYQLASRFDNIPTRAWGWRLVLYTCPKEPNHMFKTAEL